MIGIFPKRKMLPYAGQGLFTERETEHLFPLVRLIQDVSQGAYDHGVSAMIDVVAVITDTVHSGSTLESADRNKPTATPSILLQMRSAACNPLYSSGLRPHKRTGVFCRTFRT